MKSFYLRDKYKEHMEESNDRSRYYIEGDTVKSREMTWEINLGNDNARDTWDV